MANIARYVHTNLIARDWRTLAQFYIEVLGCEAVGSERDRTGPWLDQATGLRRAHLRGVHLRLPGHGDQGPTLEIFTYDETLDGPRPVANRVGLGHLAFDVNDIGSFVERVLAHGGHALGQIAGTTLPGLGDLEVVYVRDPEGNIIELQSWR